MTYDNALARARASYTSVAACQAELARYESVKARLDQEDCKTKGWLLDGFPRSGPQAEALAAAGITATHFLLLEVDSHILVERCVGRRSDPVTGKIYHLKFNPPPKEVPPDVTIYKDI